MGKLLEVLISSVRQDSFRGGHKAESGTNLKCGRQRVGLAGSLNIYLKQLPLRSLTIQPGGVRFTPTRNTSSGWQTRPAGRRGLQTRCFSEAHGAVAWRRQPCARANSVEELF